MLKKIRKKKFKALCKLLLGGVAFVGSMFMNQDSLNAMPIEDTTSAYASLKNVVYNETLKSVTGSNVTNGFISWKDFSLANGDKLTFSGMTNMLNYVPFKNPSLIYGEIDAGAVSGNFYIVNPSGILFGQDSKVIANDFHVSTRYLSEDDIKNYKLGTNPFDTNATASLINKNGLSSSDIMGAYDIADGDVMFLGQVQANSLKVEGNTIQIRNTKDIKTKDGTNLLAANKISLYSNNPVEVGYEVTTDDVEVELTNPFLFFNGESEEMTEDEFVLAVADYYGIYLALHNGTIVTNSDDEEKYGLPGQSVYYSNDSYSALKDLYAFYHEKIDELTANATAKDKLIAAFAMDQVVRQQISTYGQQIQNVTLKDADGKEYTVEYYQVPTYYYDSWSADSNYQKYIEIFNENYEKIYGEERLSNPQYKYFIADSVGDKNMPNSANKLGWTAKTLSGGTQTITDYRLVNDADDLQYINFSRAKPEEILFPVTTNWGDIILAEGKIRGNYMLGADISLSGKSFKPLGYRMTFYDYATESDLVNFNGLNFKISGLTADSDSAEIDGNSISNVGLFSAFSGTIKNLRLENFNVTGTTDSSGIGALIGTIGYNGGTALLEGDNVTWHWMKRNDQLTTTIKNVSLNGTNNIAAEYSYSNVGGLVGTVGSPVYESYKLPNYEGYVVYYVPGAPKAIFENVENFSNNTDYSVVASDSQRTTGGGIVGAKISGNLSFKNSINFANVTSTEGSGGLLGKSLNLLTYQNGSNDPIVPAVDSKYNSLSFEKVANYGNIYSSLVSGGLFAQNDAYDSENKSYDSEISIKQTFNGGNVTSDNLSGGIAGALSSPKTIDVDQVLNIGDVTGLNSGGLFGVITTNDDTTSATLKNSYNTGTVETGGYGGGIVGQLNGATISNVYNTGNVKGQISEDGYYDDEKDEWVSTQSYNAVLGGLIGSSESANNKISNSYNIGEVTNGAVTEGIVGDNSAGTFTNVQDATSADSIDVSDIYSSWSIDKTGAYSSRTWRVYQDPDNPNDVTRQPLLSAFLNGVTIKRYRQLDTAGEVDPADLITTEDPIVHTLHDSDGNEVETRYKNSGKTVTSSNLNDNGIDTSLVDYDIISSSEDDKFAVNATKYLASALMNSSQFGYNYKFENNKTDWTNATADTKTKAAYTNPADNTIYLKMKDIVPAEIDVTIEVMNGRIIGEEFTAIADTDGNEYTITAADDADIDDFKTLLSGVLKVVDKDDDHETTTVEIDETKVTSKSSSDNTYTVVKGGTTYTFKKTGEYTFKYTSEAGTTYNVTVDPGTITTYTSRTATVTAVDGEVGKETEGEFTAEKNSDDKYYSITGTGVTAIDTLLKDALIVQKNTDGTATELKFNTDNVTVKSTKTNSDGTTTYTVEKGGTSYEFTKNSDGTFTYIDDKTSTAYTVTVAKGMLTYDVNINVADTTLTDNEVTSGGTYAVTKDNNNFINNLISGKIKVAETSDGTNATLALTNGMTFNTGTATYTIGDKSYTVTKAVTDGNNVYTYKDPDTGVNYEVTVLPGDLAKTYNIDIKVSDGVYYMNSDGNNTLSLELANGYKITKNADGSKFTDNFSVKYNDPVDESQITGPAQTTVTVKNKSTNDTYNTDAVSATNGVYTNLTANADGSYSLAPITNGNFTYNITINPGQVVSSTTIPVTINVNDGKVTDGVFSGNGYTVTNTDISTLLNGKLEVVNDNGTTTVKFTDGTTLTEGEHTYTIDGKDYTITKSGDTYTYKTTNSKDEILEYAITIDKGSVTTENNNNVTVTVNDGSITNGTFTDSGYSVNNSYIGGLLAGNLKVIATNNNQNTTVTVNNSGNLTANGNNLSYTAANGTTYNFTRTATNNYFYTITEGTTTNNYNVTIVPGNIASTNTIPVTINVNDGKITDGVFSGNGYTVTNSDIATLLNGKLEVVNSGGKTSLKFSDGTTLTEGEHTYTIDGQNYTITKNGDSYVYTVTSGDDTIYYYITINKGNVTTENNNSVTVTVNDGTITNGDFTDKGYSVNNNYIAGLLEGNLKVIATNNNQNTTVTVNESGNLTQSGNNLSYTAANGTTYNFTRTATNQYRYSITDGTTTTNYNVTVVPGNITSTNSIPVTISVGDGRYSDGVVTVAGGGNEYTIDNNNIATLLTDVLTLDRSSDGNSTTLKFNDNVTVNSTTQNSNGTTTYNVTKDGTAYTFTKNTDGTYTYTDNTNPNNVLIYTVTVDPGSLTYDVKVKVADMTITDNEVTSGGGYQVTSDNNNFINALISGKIEVVETADGLNTTVAATNTSALTRNGNNYTYTDGDKVYNFTKSGNVYTYNDSTTGVTYEVTIEQGALEKIYNIGIQVSDGVFYINEDGKGNLSLNLPNGYKITKNADGSKFTDTFTVSYNEPLETAGDTTQVTDKYTTTVSVTNKADNNAYTTNDFDKTVGGYNQITPNADGSYTINPITNGNVTYNITIKPGAVVSDTKVPVVISVNDGKVTDGVFEGGGYTVTNSDIATLLNGKLEVVNKDGKTTVQFKDGTTLQDGEHTYTIGGKSYTIEKSGDTYIYKTTNSQDEILEYSVTIDTGDIKTENNNNVTVTVNDGKLNDGVFTGNGYSVNNDVIAGLLDGNLKVIATNDNKNTTVTVNNGGNLSADGNNLSYTAADGKTYNFTRIATNQYRYTITDGNTTNNYTVNIVNGNITNQNTVPVTISVGDGKITDGTLTSGGYTTSNDGIATLLTDVLTVGTNTDGTATELKFKDGVNYTSTPNSDGTTTYTVTKDGTPYTFTKNTDGTYTYTDNTDPANVKVYTVTVNAGSLTYGVNINVADTQMVDNEVTSGGTYEVTSDHNNFINDLIGGKISVVETADGLNTTLAATNSSALTQNGNNYTYTDGGTVYNFTKSGNVYTYKDDSTGVTYEVTVNPGDLEKTYNIDIQVSDGVYYMNQNGEGNLSLNLKNGYSITKNANGSKFTDDFTVKYNDPADLTQITGPATTTVTVTNTKDNNNTYDTDKTNPADCTYSNLTPNADGTYSLAPITNGNYTYNITINPGQVVSDTRIPVTINVNDGRVTDGVFRGNGYTVTNSDIATLLEGKLKVVNVDGKTTVQFTDGTTLQDGEHTYTFDGQDYTITKSGDTYIYKVTNPNDEVIEYAVKINTGDVAVSNNKLVLITVGDGTITDGVFADGGFTTNLTSIDDPALENLIKELTVTQTDDGNHTTIDFPSGISVIDNGDGSYTFTTTASDGTVTNYTIEIDPGDIAKYHNEGVVINVGDGKNDNGTFTGDGYTISNDTIGTLLDGVIKVTTTDNSTTKLDFVDKSAGVFTDNGDGTFIYKKDGVDYPFTKIDDNTYTYNVTDDDGVINQYTITINPGSVTNYYDVDVTLDVGDGTLSDGTFTDSGYTVDDAVIGGLLDGELGVTYNSVGQSTNVKFSDADNLTFDGTNYVYDKNGTKYYFTKNVDGTYHYVVTDGNTITTYNVTVTPGVLNIKNTEKATSEPTPTPADPEPATPSTEPTTPTTPATPSTPSTTPTTPTTPSTPSTTPTTTPTTSTPTTSPTTTPTTSTPTTSPTSTPTTTTPTTSPTSTPVTTPTTSPTDDTPTETPTTTPVETEPVTEPVTTPTETEPVTEPTTTPTETEPLVQETEIVTTIVDEPTPPVIGEPEPTPLTDEPTPVVDEPTPTAETETPTEELDNPDYELRGSNIEEFPEEKGDYVDLDSQDHILIETTESNEIINELDVTPEEFQEANARNIVNNNNTELNTISDTPTSTESTTPNVEVSNQNNNGGLTSINSNSNSTTSNTPSNATNNTPSTSGNTNPATTGTSNSNATSNSSSNAAENRTTTTRGESALQSIGGNESSASDETSAENVETSDESSSLGENMSDLGAIESGRSDSSQEATVNQTSDNSNTQSTSQSKSTDNQTSQKSNSDNKTSQENDSDDDDSDSGEGE